MSPKLKPPHKRHVKMPNERPNKRIRARAEDSAPIEPIIVKSPGRRLDRSLKP